MISLFRKALLLTFLFYGCVRNDMVCAGRWRHTLPMRWDGGRSLSRFRDSAALRLQRVHLPL